jgi:hypothetical protein
VQSPPGCRRRYYRGVEGAGTARCATGYVRSRRGIGTEKASGAFIGRTKVTGQGRPGLRLAAWRAGWAAIKGNEVYAARLAHLTARESSKLTPTQAQAAVAAALLRQLHAVVTTGRQWDPEIATHGTRRPTDLAVAA